jgi:hypothetical protein
MAKSSQESSQKSSQQKPKKERVTASGLVEAIEQDVELSAEQIKDAAHEAVVAVEKKLGVGKAAKPKAAKTSKLKK